MEVQLTTLMTCKNISVARRFWDIINIRLSNASISSRTQRRESSYIAITLGHNWPEGVWACVCVLKNCLLSTNILIVFV